MSKKSQKNADRVQPASLSNQVYRKDLHVLQIELVNPLTAVGRGKTLLDMMVAAGVVAVRGAMIP